MQSEVTITNGTIRLGGALLVGMSLFSSIEVIAQETASGGGAQLVLEEVFVTARRREEALQDTPVAISAFSAEALRTAGIANTRDLQEFVPGLVFAEMSTKTPSIFIRGVGQKESIAALDPGVGVYINSIYIARTDSQILDIVDPASVQVLRGPQGTLFGKNNIGGALLVTTELPHTDEFSGEVMVRAGNHGRADVKVTGNIPLIQDKLAARFSLNSTNLDGYLESTYDGKKYGDEDRLGATARVVWNATDTFTADLFYYWSRIDENGVGLTCYFQNPDASINTLTFPGFTEVGAYQRQCIESQQAASDYKLNMNGPTRFKMNNQLVGLTLEWELDKFDFKSITAWSGQEDIQVGEDVDGTDMPVALGGGYSIQQALRRSVDAGYGDFTVPDDENRDQYSQELQLSGTAFDDRLAYTTGIFLSREEIRNNGYGIDIGYRGYAYRPESITLLPKILATNSDMTNESNAVFAQGSYDFTEWYQLTVGTRFTTEKREREASLYEADCQAIFAGNFFPGALNGCAADVLFLSDPSGFYANPPSFMPIRLVEEYETVSGEIITAVNGRVKQDNSWSEWTPTITNSFNIPYAYLENTSLDSALVYFTYSKGFKSGGFEMKGLEMTEFSPESVTNYELGVKIDALDQRVRFNAAFYYMDYDDIQVRIAEQGRAIADILLFIDNAGAATIQGFETELTVLPLPNVILTASSSYTDASYDDFTATSVDSSVVPPVQMEVDRSNEPFAGIPKITYSLSATAILDTPIGDFTPRLSMYYRDSFFTGLDPLAGTDFKNEATIDDVTLWNFRLGYMPVTNDNLQVWLFVNNLTDENYFQGGFSQTDSLGAGSYVLGPPRTYGIELSYRF